MGKITDALIKYKDYTDKETVHSYGRVYDNLFEKMLDKQINILEIGVQDGGSILAWNECFTNADIIGVDIDTSKFKNPFNASLGKVWLIQGNILDVKLHHNFDIIIHDGSHILEEVVDSFKELYPNLNQGGIYIIEDVQNIPLWEEEIRKLLSTSDNLRCIDLRDKKGRPDDYLIIIQKN